MTIRSGMWLRRFQRSSWVLALPSELLASMLTIFRYIADTIYLPCTFEQLRTTSAGDPLRTLVDHLSHSVDNPAIINALL